MGSQAVLPNSFLQPPQPPGGIETQHRRIQTSIPSSTDSALLRQAAELFPQVNCYQPPVVWDRAEGYQVFDAAGNCWIDFSSTAVMTNTGHGHPRIREAVAKHAERGLLAQFSFPSEIRIQLAAELVKVAPARCEKVYFWTVGSEAIEAALRLAREWGTGKKPEKHRILVFRGDYHGWTLGAHQLSGESASKDWLAHPDRAIHHLPYPPDASEREVAEFFDRAFRELSERTGIGPVEVAGVVLEAMQGWSALPLSTPFVQRIREWADQHDVLLIVDEIQTGFGRTGKFFAHEHYGIEADLVCIGKGVTSTLPLAAVLGPAEVLDVLAPGQITTTHAGHPLACAAALANLEILRDENLVEEAARKGAIAARELERLQARFPRLISQTTGRGLLRALHVTDPNTGMPSRELARDWTFASVQHGVMLFQVNQPTLKICPPLVIPDEALVEGIRALGDALASIQG